MDLGCRARGPGGAPDLERSTVVTQDEDGGRDCRHRATSEATGSVTWRLAHPCGLFSTPTAPPCAWTMARTMARPMPSPSVLVVERFEDVAKILLRDAGPRVLHRDPERGGVVSGRPDNEGACPRVRLPHGFEAIEHQVEHHLLELDPVAMHAREAACRRKPSSHGGVRCAKVRWSGHDNRSGLDPRNGPAGFVVLVYRP